MAALKIVLVGGGSYAWSPQFIRDLITTPALQGSTIILQDIDSEALDLVYRLGLKLIHEQASGCQIQKTTALEEALPDADIVILTITTGGLEAMRADIEIPEKYGVFQSVGDTVGPGGLARALRNIPVVVDIAQAMTRHCPAAWLLNYTNPMTTLCRAVTRETSIHTIGLCHEYLGVRHALQEIFDLSDPNEIKARVAGINHLIWILDLEIRGQDAFSQLQMWLSPVTGPRPGSTPDENFPSLTDHHRVKSRLLEIYDALPAAGDRHVAEFFPYFLSEAADRGQRYELTRTSIEERYRWRASDKAYLETLLNNAAERQAFLTQRSEEAVAPILSARAGAASYEGILNLPNKGQIANLPADVIVETFGVIDADGARGLPAGNLPPGILNVISTHVNNQEMIVEAALTGNKSLALQALVNDPLLGEIDHAEQLLDDMLITNRKFLPKFFE